MELMNPLILITFFPLIGFLIIAFFKEEQKPAIRWTALITSLITFGLSIWMLFQYDSSVKGLQLVVNVPWLTVSNLTIHFGMGIDGLSLMMVLLTTFLVPIVLLSTWGTIQERVKGFTLFFLLLEVGMNGVFLATDLILFYIFWEFTLVPMYFIIGVWGGKRKIYAAVKFFLFTMAGSILMLVAILFMGNQAGTFALDSLLAARHLFADWSLWLFLAFAVAFAIKVPMFPLHTWLPDAHVEAPAAGSVILAGVLLKMGCYGFLRFNLPLFPEIAVQAAPWIAILAVIGIIYGAMLAFAQKDVKKLVAYSSVSHLGFVMLGIFALNEQGMAGGILQMVNHGLSTGALFLIVGMLYERRHDRQMSAYGGIWKVLPLMGAFMLIVMLSSVGLPGLNGFVGEFTILMGAFTSTVLNNPWIAGVATAGVILAAVYLLTMFEKVFLGKIKDEALKKMPDLNVREIITLVPLLIVIFWIGLYPKFFLDLINPAVENLLAVIQQAAMVMH